MGLLFRLLLCLLVSGVSYSQDLRVIDSLKSSLGGRNGIERYKVLNEIGIQYFYARPDSALRYFSKSREISIALGDSVEVVKSMRRSAQTLVALNRINEAIDHYDRAVHIARRNSLDADYLQILNGLGVCYAYQGEYNLGLAKLLTALQYNEQVDDLYQRSITFINLGYVYFKLKDYAKALDYFKQSERLKSAVNDKGGILQVFVNSAICYAYLDDPVNADKYLREFEIACHGECSDHLNLQMKFARALLAFQRRDFAQAEQLFLTSYQMSASSGFVRYQLDNIDYLSQLYVTTGKPFQARQFLQKAERLLEKNSPLNLEAIKIYLRFSELSYAAREFELMAFYQKKYIALRDSVFGETLANSIRKTEVAHLEAESTARLKEKNEIIALKEQVIRSQYYLIGTIVVVAILLIAFIVALFKISRERKEINQKLELKVLERTQELETNHTQLQQACRERDHVIARMWNTINTSLASFRGICDVGLKETTDDNSRLYLQRISQQSETLAASLDKLRSVHGQSAV